ncbi:MAG: hypothetical protein F4Y26_04610 [Gammaproteobacteria bacterium]|nr:hypothetical protein [Gammaproteobacteria bacterium]
MEFTIDWQAVVRGCRMYWVEAMRYRPPAYRFLITEHELPNSKFLTHYDPSAANGPVIYRDGAWYWNGTCTSEFMVAADLPLARFSRMSFVDHHQQYCRGGQNPCRDQRMSAYDARLVTLSFVLAYSLHTIDHGIRYDTVGLEQDEVDQFVNLMTQRLTVMAERFRGRRTKKKSRAALIRGILALWSCRRFSDASVLASRFPSAEALQDELCDLIAEHFGLPSYQPTALWSA